MDFKKIRKKMIALLCSFGWHDNEHFRKEHKIDENYGFITTHRKCKHCKEIQHDDESIPVHYN